MDELLKVKKQIEDLKEFKPRAKGSEFNDGWQSALTVVEGWVTSRISALNRNSDVRPY